MADEKNPEAKLLEISKEAQKLTRMINSFPKAQSFDYRSIDITKDLMRGAFGLQESLITLRNMSEKKEKLKFDFGSGSGRFERLAMDGSLFDYIDELKKVMKESNSSQQVKVCSSSRSLGFLMSKEPEKAKGPNLIAKLMGLQELPLEIDNPKRKEHKSILNIEMPKTRRLQSMEMNTELGTKTVNGIVEVVKSKEVFDSDKNKEHRRFDNEISTNVPMRNQFDKILVSKKTRANNLIPEVIVCRNGQLPLRKSERKEVKNMKKNKVLSNQMTANLTSVSEKKQRKVVISTREKGSPLSRYFMNGKKPREMKELKISAAPKSPTKLASRTPVKPDSRKSRIKKDISLNDQIVVSKGANASRKLNSTFTLKPILQKNSNVEKVKKTTEAKAFRKSMDIKAVIGGITNSKHIKESNQSFNSPVDPPIKQVKQNSESCHTVFTEERRKGDKSSTSPENSIQLPENKTNLLIESGAEAEEKIFLQNNQHLIKHAQELFGLHVHQAKDHHKKRTEVLLDCAKEFMFRKKHQIELSNHRLLQTSLWGRATVVSMDRLVDETGNGIKKLNGYSKNGGGVSLKDGVYVRLEMDLRCKDVMMNAIWDVGWVNWICVEEADIIVAQVEEMLLYGIVEELVVELL